MGKYKLNDNLKNTWESMDMLRRDYLDAINDCTPKSAKMIQYILGLPEFERDIFILYCEYNSLRDVAEETNRGYGTIASIIKRIKEDLKCLK